MRTKLRRGSRVVCTHYKDRPVYIVDAIVPASRSSENVEEVWVAEYRAGVVSPDHWWGPRSWFRKLSSKRRG